MTQVLHIMNGNTLNSKLENDKSRPAQLAAEGDMSAERVIDEAYLSALTRFPTDDEKSKLLAILGDAGDAERRLLVEDLYWSILSSKEFLFNH